MKININKISKVYSEYAIFDDCSFDIVLGSKVAIIGENGSGKSTLLKMICGLEPLTEGDIFIPKDNKTGYLKQEFDDFDGTAYDYLMRDFKDLKDLEKRIEEVSLELSTTEDIEKTLNLYGRLQSEFETLGGYELDNEIERISNGLDVEHLLFNDYNTLSGGEKTRFELVRLLSSDVDILCLDEPTNHLDFKGIEWLEDYCKGLNKTLIIVSHDREFLNNVATIFHDIEYGDVVTYHGDFDSFRKQKNDRFESLVKDYNEQQKIIHKIKLAIRRYRQWGNESDNEDFFKKAKTLEKKLEKMETLPKPEDLSNRLELSLDIQNRSGKDVLKLEDLCIGYEKVLQENINLNIYYKERYAILGRNGSGKSTLIKTILKDIEPLCGDVKIGSNVNIGYLSQEHSFEDDSLRMIEYTTNELNMSEFKARQLLARFGFYQNDVYKPLRMLSGGEKVRILLMSIMTKDHNFIILDEPTNHLDIQSCEILEDVLVSYEGTLLVVSHDRYFLNKLQLNRFYIE